MRRIIFMMSISLDGFMEGPNRELDWHAVDEELHRHFNSECAKMSLFMDGRVTHELMAGYWPHADEDPDSTPTEAEFAGIWRDMPKIVFSKTLEQADWNTTIATEVDPEQIAALKSQPGGDILIGGADLGATFMRLGLIDEYRLYLHPVFIGAGKPLFPPGAAALDLDLEDTKTFGNGVVLLRYKPRRAQAG